MLIDRGKYDVYTYIRTKQTLAEYPTIGTYISPWVLMYKYPMGLLDINMTVER